MIWASRGGDDDRTMDDIYEKGGGRGKNWLLKYFFMQIVNVMMIVFFSWLGARVLEFWDLGVESKGKATLKVTILF